MDHSSSQKQLLSSIPSLLRRRLTPLAKTVFCSAIPCLTENNSIPTVFSSTHGELAKSFKMMETIERGEDISPTSFSLSVHNAIAGLFSMAFSNKIQSSVVAPGEEGIAAAFIEASGLLDEGENEILIILYDEPLVDFYPSHPFQLSTTESRSVTLSITKSGKGIPIYFSCQHSTGYIGEQPIQIPLLINFLKQNQDNLIIPTPRHSWCWKRV
jgi:hypothetical protein